MKSFITVRISQVVLGASVLGLCLGGVPTKALGAAPQAAHEAKEAGSEVKGMPSDRDGSSELRDGAPCPWHRQWGGSAPCHGGCWQKCCGGGGCIVQRLFQAALALSAIFTMISLSLFLLRRSKM